MPLSRNSNESLTGLTLRIRSPTCIVYGMNCTTRKCPSRFEHLPSNWCLLQTAPAHSRKRMPLTLTWTWWSRRIECPRESATTSHPPRTKVVSRFTIVRAPRRRSKTATARVKLRCLSWTFQARSICSSFVANRAGQRQRKLNWEKVPCSRLSPWPLVGTPCTSQQLGDMMRPVQ